MNKKEKSYFGGAALMLVAISGCAIQPTYVGPNAQAIGCAREEILVTDQHDNGFFVLPGNERFYWSESCRGRKFNCVFQRFTMTCEEVIVAGGALQTTVAAPTATAALAGGPLGTGGGMSAIAATEPEIAVDLPEPIFGNTGAFMCPFTEDATIAPWVEKGRTAKIGSNVGGAVGSYAGQKALEQIPFLGGFLGKKAGEATGKQVAIMAAGGWEFIKSSSDLSFNSLADMARYVQAKHSAHPQYTAALEATYGIYPEFKEAVLKTVSR